MPIKVGYMKHGSNKVKSACMNCYYFNKSVGVLNSCRCHAGSCPDLTLTEEEKQYFVKNWNINHFEEELTMKELMRDHSKKMADEIAADIDAKIFDDILGGLL